MHKIFCIRLVLILVELSLILCHLDLELVHSLIDNLNVNFMLMWFFFMFMFILFVLIFWRPQHRHILLDFQIVFSTTGWRRFALLVSTFLWADLNLIF